MTSSISDADYINVHLHIPEEQFDIALGIISLLPMLGIEERFDELVISFTSIDFATISIEELENNLKNIGISVEIGQVEPLTAQNWNAEFEKSLQPVIVSERIVIAPSWAEDIPAAEIILRIDPKMSFGTGYHPTTRMVCQFLEQYVRPKSHWIDAGSGTGILSILAARLGASNIFAFDNDAWAVDNCAENIASNNVRDIVLCSQADVFFVDLPQSDGIVANLFRNLLVPVFPRFRKALTNSKGVLIVSGILVYDLEDICTAAESSGFHTLSVKSEGEWLAIAFESM